ncbi:MAG: hypothetical protein ACR2QK_19940 [Acidimicrobiales bacterium]
MTIDGAETDGTAVEDGAAQLYRFGREIAAEMARARTRFDPAMRRQILADLDSDDRARRRIALRSIGVSRPTIRQYRRLLTDLTDRACDVPSGPGAPSIDSAIGAELMAGAAVANRRVARRSTFEKVLAGFALAVYSIDTEARDCRRMR